MATCQICGHGPLVEFLDLGDVPVFCNVQFPTRQEALQAPTGRLLLVSCANCGHLCNSAVDESLLRYAPGYENSQHFSSTFREYADQLVDRLIAAHELRGKVVVDIGCGRGDLLELFSQRGGAKAFGFDPSASDAAVSSNRLCTISRERFTTRQSAELRPGLLCLRHVLEHVTEPLGFLREMHAVVEAAGDCVLYVEVPNGDHLLESAGLWDYIYEHVSYFSAMSLRRALELSGFEILDLRSGFGGQFLCATARVAAAGRTVGGTDGTSPFGQSYTSNEMRRKLDWWRGWTAAVTRERGPVMLWGAGSKGVSFLNFMGLREPGVIDFVIDQNPGKAGRYIAGTGQQIIAPEAEVLRHVSQIVLMNAIYLPEVGQRLASLGSYPTLLCADGLAPRALPDSRNS